MYHLLSCICDAVRRACSCVADALKTSHRRAVARRELRSIDEHTLRDIGLSHRAAAEWPRQRDAW